MPTLTTRLYKRQPVHTVYGGAHLFKSDSAERLGALSRRALDQFAPDYLSFAKAIGLPGADQLPEPSEADEGAASGPRTSAELTPLENKAALLARSIYHRVNEKLRREAVEDFRIDFE
ncbi:MAG: phosphoenolpyruvate kinase, partial [Pyrinomonadaceae bacterium]